jgi:Mitochondrial carrier protein
LYKLNSLYLCFISDLPQLQDSVNSKGWHTAGENMSTTADIEDNTRRHPQNEWMADFIAGWISGAVSIMACQPIDTILTRLQATPATAVLVARSDWRLITMDLYRKAGPAALWRGASPVIVAAPLQNALLMGGYGFGSRCFVEQNENVENASLSRAKQLSAIFVGGCTGGELGPATRVAVFFCFFRLLQFWKYFN